MKRDERFKPTCHILFIAHDYYKAFLWKFKICRKVKAVKSFSEISLELYKNPS